MIVIDPDLSQSIPLQASPVPKKGLDKAGGIWYYNTREALNKSADEGISPSRKTQTTAALAFAMYA